MEEHMQAQTRIALAEADAALFLFDARTGLTPLDRHFAGLLRAVDIPIILVANKSEGNDGLAAALEGHALGLGEPIPISAEHGEGMADLHAALAPVLDAAVVAEAKIESPQDDEGIEANGPVQLAIVGRPNVGKSTLLNRLLDEERVITGPEPGVTRDSITVEWSFRGRPIKLIDTAGIRRRSRVRESLEKLSVADSLRAIRFAQVVVLVIDANQPMEKQDLSLAELVVEEGRSLVIAVNKWDAVSDRQAAMERVRDRLQTSLPQIRGVSVVTLSALTGAGVDKLMPAAVDAEAIWSRRVSTGRLNRWFAALLEYHPPPLVRGRRIRLRYVTQIKTRPPTFAIFTSSPLALPASYLRYVANALRDDFDLPGVPIRVYLRKTENPYDKDSR